VLTKAWIPSMMIFLSGAAVIVTLKQCRRSLYVVGVATATGVLLLMLRGRISHERLVLEGTSYGNSNTIAIMLLVGMPMVWLLAASARAGLLRKVLVGGVMILMLVALFRTGSREGVVGLAVLLGTAFVRSSMAGKVKLVIAVAALVAGAVLFLPHSLKSRFATVFQGATVEVEGAQTPEEQRLLMVASRSSSDRWALLRTSLDLTLRHPLLGVGPGQFAPYVAGVAKDKGMLTGWNGTHNTYTQLSSEAGIPALCLYVATMLVSMRGLQRICRRARGVTGGEARDIASMALALHASFIAYCVCALFNHMAYELTMPLMAGITVAIRRLAPDELNRLEDAERRQVGVPLSFLPVSPKRSRFVAGGGRTA